MESSDSYKSSISKKIDEIEQLQQKPEKIFNPLTNRFIKNTPANRKKIEKNNTSKIGGKSKKTIKKIYKKNKFITLKNKNKK